MIKTNESEVTRETSEGRQRRLQRRYRCDYDAERGKAELPSCITAIDDKQCQSSPSPSYAISFNFPVTFFNLISVSRFSSFCFFSFFCSAPLQNTPPPCQPNCRHRRRVTAAMTTSASCLCLCWVPAALLSVQSSSPHSVLVCDVCSSRSTLIPC